MHALYHRSNIFCCVVEFVSQQIGVMCFSCVTSVTHFFILGGVKMKAPECCPMCNNITSWKKVDETKKGFSVGKAAVGGLLLGPVGLVGGALGKKKVYYCCGACGFEHEYDK